MTQGGNAPKARARLITCVWGEAYLHKLLEMALPSVLAPGNYPYLATVFDVEFVLVTERRLFALFQSHPVCQQLRKYGGVQLVSLDDLLLGPASYGLSLTKALYRSFQDLGPAVTETNLLFLNADFILADDSYRVLASKLLAGERLVVSPSYCAIEEEVEPLLLRHRSELALACPKRRMAEYILRYLHDTVRGQIIDNPFHYDHVYVYQHYARPNLRTLIGHQMPIAIVAMRPTRQLEAPRTFWDFGAVSEFCPDATHCVLGDSDEFLMLELRARREGVALLRLGPPQAERIARLVGPIFTKDQRDFGQYPLVVHAEDLSADITASRRRLKEFHERLYAALPRDPSQHVNHPLWRYHATLFEEAEAAALAAAQIRGGTGAANIESVVADHPVVDPSLRAERADHPRDDQAAPDCPAQLNPPAPGDRMSIDQLALEVKRCVADVNTMIVDYFDRAAPVHALMSAHFKFGESARGLRMRLRAISRALSAGRDSGEEFEAERPRRDIRFVAMNPEIRMAAHSLSIVRRQLRRIRDLLLGTPPEFSRLHPLRLAYEIPAQLLSSALVTAKKVLVVSDGRAAIQSSIVRSGKLNMQIALQDALYGGLETVEDKFDLVYIEIMLENVAHLRRVIANLREILSENARAIVLVTNPRGDRIPVDDPEFVHSTFDIGGVPQATYFGGRLASFAYRRYCDGIVQINWDKPLTVLRYAAVTLVCLPIALLANVSVSIRTADPRVVRSSCLSFVLDVVLD